MKSKAWKTILTTGVSALVVSPAIAGEIKCVKGKKIDISFYEPYYTPKGGGYVLQFANTGNLHGFKLNDKLIRGYLFARGDIKDDLFSVMVYWTDSYGDKSNPYNHHYVGALAGSKNAKGEWTIKYLETTDAGQPAIGAKPESLKCNKL